MEFSNISYLAPDRVRTLISGSDLPQVATGVVLFADISGFTPLTEQFRGRLGNRRGAEALAVLLNQVYDALVAEVDGYGGSIIGFAGDAITCWFSGDASTTRAAACGFALLTAMRAVEQVTLLETEPLSLGLKVAITTGITHRFLVGDPDIQRIDTLAGAVVARVAIGEALAERGELLADAVTIEQLGDGVQIRGWREADGERFAVLDRLTSSVQPTAPVSENDSSADESLLAPLLLQFTRNLPAGVDTFQIELRPVTALFLRFTGIDYDHDPEAGEKLDRLIRLVQKIVAGYEGNVLQLTVGDKGSYLYAAFGAPYAHEDDPTRALSAALDIRDQTMLLDFLNPVQIGISRGIMRTGAYGSTTRRTYGALGDEVNLAARLMQYAEPGTILM
ncbi:MAG: adenylate/guanylate cyclase domain-containing protein, partial [Chloroflexota bacterium]